MPDSVSGPTHRRAASNAHRRRSSSISLPHPSTNSLRTSDGPSDYSTFPSGVNLPYSNDPSAPTAHLSKLESLEARIKLAEPSLENPDVSVPGLGNEDLAHGRMASFSFGSKSVGPSSTSPNPLLPPPTTRRRARPSSIAHTPRSSISESSRPPSLVVTGPSIPSNLDSLSNALQSSLSEALPPSTSSTRSRKHSHTRSNSISLPNLKLGRPTSLTASSLTSSFPSSPISPDSDSTTHPNPSRVTTSRRLKFEPSGRGAEAELAKEESRRRALEKLTGVSQRPDTQNADIESIVLPSMDLDVESSIPDGVGTRPHLGFGQGQALDTLPLLDPMSGHASRSPSPSTSAISPQLPAHLTFPRNTLPLSRMSKAGSLGPFYELDRDVTTVSKRISVTSALGVLQEEDENEAPLSISHSASPISAQPATQVPDTAECPIPKPPSSGLRQLRLLSPPSHKSTFLGGQTQPLNSFSLASPADIGDAAHTPTKRSLANARHRPQSLHLSSPLFIDDTSSPSGPGSVRPDRNRKSFGTSTPDRRSTRSGSLSYKKTPSGDTTTQGTSDTSIFGDIVTPSFVDHDLPLHQSTSTVNSHTGSTTAQHLSWSSPSPWQFTDVARSDRWTQPTPMIEPPPIHNASVEKRRTSTSDSISLNWQGGSLDLALQRDTMEEDRDMWRARCMAAEAKLEDERRERAILQSRIRKRTSIPTLQYDYMS